MGVDGLSQNQHYVFSNGNSLWKSNCKLGKNYEHKIVRHMRMNKFNEPLHSDITSIREI